MGIKELVSRNGILNLTYKAFSLVRSGYIRRSFNYGNGFSIGLTTVWMGGEGAKIGQKFKMGRRCRVEIIHSHNGLKYAPHLIVGDRVSLNDDVHIACAHEIFIGNDVLMASKIFISDHDHGSYTGDEPDTPNSAPNDRLLNLKPVIIGDRVWIGEMVSVLPGVKIGAGSIIGAGSVVTKSIPEGCIAVGSPARVVKKYNTSSGLWEAFRAE
ncbi:DapH/DapD/GlmU-related protein [Deinococcus soli (ex Cha et al. 2016)]|uniref:DapH/DapD/GlmU-related protein n=1 Tax=Deinococcus soli (ex Cha et al. 2016) TaxID=1309411 RepID=UPI0019AFCE16|nr:DapH/DapD/GlmU-related protein [Deinococcus soli (ex Cha et al. 2016)]GGB76788.1 hypothetical protein GCM10008019_36270 [Deinococcus soli (ex Cha et al. 2016)]